MAPHLPFLSHRWSRLIAGALALPLAGSLQPAQAATLLSFLSSPYSWVGRGETVSAGPDNGFDISVLGDQFTPITQITSTLNFTITEPWTLYGWRSWDLRLAAPEGAILAVGSYANATLSSFMDTTAPGLDFSGNGRGNNRLTGSFNILSPTLLTTAPSPSPSTFYNTTFYNTTKKVPMPGSKERSDTIQKYQST